MMHKLRKPGDLNPKWSSHAGLQRTLRVLPLFIASACYGFAQTTDSQIQEITSLEHQRAAAVVHRDTDFLDKITAQESIRILPDGALQSKAELLGELKSGSVTYASITVDEILVKVYGTTALGTGRSAVNGQSNGKAFGGSWRFSRVWIRKEGRWQEVMFQLTAIQQT